MLQPVVHLFHYLLLVQLTLIAAVLLNPIIIAVAAVLMLLPPQKIKDCAVWIQNTLKKGTQGRSGLLTDDDLDRISMLYNPNASMNKMIWAAMNVSLHTWVWMYVGWMLLCPEGWTRQTFAKGFCYMILSELFLHGFAFHPYFGYFLGVHRSFGQGFIPKGEGGGADTGTGGPSPAPTPAYRPGDNNIADCQPTMSTYGWVTSFASLNLNLHVEHHDFPKVPWSRLPQVKPLAPEYGARFQTQFCTRGCHWIPRMFA
jgi:hypothetical protein